MEFSPKVSQKFLNLFRHLDTQCCEAGTSHLNLFVLDIRSNRFIYEALVSELYDVIITYALSNTRLKEYQGTYGGKAFVEAREKLRKYSQNDGELGEILLYSFLETHLKAPKLLSKLEIKTSSNDYVKGADGVHLLSLPDAQHKILFGESKMRPKLLYGVSDAFRSIKKFSSEKLNFETTLVDSQLLKEAVTDEEYFFLKSILLPSESDQLIDVDYAFALFIGYNVEISESEIKLPNDKFRSLVYEKVSSEVFESFTNIQAAIERHELYGYDFHVYVVPFTKLDETRQLLIKRLAEA